MFVVNNNITTTEENLGSISGVVKSVSQTGLNVNVTHNTSLAIFDATNDIPALGAGSASSALDLCNQLSTRQILLKDIDGHFYSLRGHSAGFDSDGFVVDPQVSTGSYQQYSQQTGQFYTAYYRQQYGTIWADDFDVIDNKIWATHVTGDAFANNPGIPISRLAFKTFLNGGNLDWGFSALPDDSNTSQGQDLFLNINYASNTFTIYGKFRNGGLLQSFTQSYDMGTLLDKDEELAVFIEYVRPVSPATQYSYKVTVCNTSNYEITGSLTQLMTTAVPIFNSEWYILGNVRSVYRHQGSGLASWVFQEYENDVTYEIDADVVLGGPVPAQPGANMWEYLQAACSAYSVELSSIDGIVSVRNVGDTFIKVDNETVPSISPNMTLSGRSVEVVYSNSSNIVDKEIYNAYTDNNRVISVNANETITTTVEINGTPALVYLPSPSATPQSGVGEYAISYSNGAQVPQKAWADNGGKLDVNINPNNPNAIDITLIGPSSVTNVFGGSGATYPGPYKLAFTAGGTDYAALSITATGVKTSLETVKIYTAADHSKVAQDVAKTIVNPFISTKLQAYDRGIWAVAEASGPRVTFSSSIPAREFQSFGLSAGSLFRYGDSIYRISQASIGNLMANITAVRHVTVDDFDTLWAGKTVGAHDLMWAGFDTSDQVIAPLRYIGDDESVLMFLDEDVNPYYDFTGEPEISVFPDEDYNPYYEDGGNLDGEDPVYLDVDQNPYDGGEGYGS